MKKLYFVFAIIFFVVFFSMCDNGVVSFGPQVNTQVPVISTPEEEKGSGPGAFLRGNNNIVFINVEQPFGLNSVFMTLRYTDLKGQSQEKIVHAKQDERGLWYVVIDSTDMEDGSIRTYVTAVDVSKNSTSTTEMIYIVKNTPARIELTIPKVTNYDSPDLNVNTEMVAQGNDILGIASDAFGIEAGYPQVMLWPADYENVDDNGVPLSSDKKYGQWRTATDSKRGALVKDGLKAVQFRWPLVELEEDEDGSWNLPSYNQEILLSSGLYRFKIRVMDKFGIINTYPNRLDNSFGYEETDSKLNHYIEFKLQAASGPIVQWYDFPQYHNGKVPLKVLLRITSENEIQSVRVGIGNEEDRASVQNWTEVESGVVENMYEVIIPPSQIPSGAGEKFFFVSISDGISSSVVYRAFILDDVAPTLSFIEPIGLGSFETPALTSSAVFRAISDDNTRVARIYYALGKTEGAALDLSEEPLDMNVDEINPGYGWTDTNLHASPREVHPGPGFDIKAKWGGGLYSWDWRFSDIADVCKYPVQAIDSSGNYYVEDYQWHNNLWTLPVYFKIVDIAGNVKVYQEIVIADPDADKPVVVVNSHTNGQTVGGSVRINGSATDNELIYAVQARVFMQTDEECGSDTYPSHPVTNGFEFAGLAGNTGTTASWFYNINGDGSLKPPAGAAVRTVLVEFRALDANPENPHTFKQYGNITSLLLNFDNTIPVIDNISIIRGKPSQEDEAYIENYQSGSRVSEFVTLKAKIRDNGGVTSIMLKPQESVNFTDRINSVTANDTNSYIVPPKELRPGDSVTFGRLYYIKESGPNNNFASLQARPPVHIPVVDAGGNFTAINNNVIYGGTLIEANVPFEDFAGEDQFFEYTLYIPLNTNADAFATDSILNGRYHNSAGNYEIAVQVTDNTHPVPYILNETLQLQIDNYYPLGLYNGNLNAIGDSYSISGRAWDTGNGISVQALEMVVVYLSRNGEPVSLNEKAGVEADWVTNQKAMINRRGGTNSLENVGVLEDLPFFPDVRQSDGVFVTTNSGIVINTTGNSGGYQVSFTGNPVRDWSAIFDTNRLTDGPVTVNYVVFDTAGNASHFSRDIYVANNRPLIKKITLGTKFNNATSAIGNNEDNEFESYNVSSPLEITTNFRIRYNRFNICADTEQGNGQKQYRVSHVTRSGPVSVQQIKKGEVYTIFDGGNVNWTDYGVFEIPQNNSLFGVTFTATTDYLGLGNGAVYVYAHNGNENTIRTGYIEDDSVQDIDFDDASFGAEPLISDSVTSVDGNGYPVLNRNRFFIIKVFDTTIEEANEEEQLSAVVLINTDTHNTDTFSPKVTIDPFYWKNADDNSLYRNSKDNGHIELSNDLWQFNQSTGVRDKDPKVSGKISIRGSAYDTHRMENLYFRISNSAVFTANGTDTQTISDVVYYRCAISSGSRLVGRGNFETDGWQFSITKQNYSQSGHNVTWQLDFDTNRFPTNGVGLDINVNVVARDAVLMNYSPVTSYRMDIVPYITSIETSSRINGGIRNDNIRSADGKYSIAGNTNTGTGSVNITIHGFNLSQNYEGTIAICRILNESQNSAYFSNHYYLAGKTGAYEPMANYYSPASLDMGNNIPSGYLTVFISDGTGYIGTLNNINYNQASGSYVYDSLPINEEHYYNYMADPYITKNKRLTDDVYLQLYNVLRTRVKNGYYPVMMIEQPNNVVVFGYVDHTGGDPGTASIGANTNAGNYHPDQAMPQRAKFNLSNAQMLDTEFLAKMSACEQMAMARDDSGRYLHVFNYDAVYSNLNMVYDRYAELHTINRNINSLGTAWAQGVYWSDYESADEYYPQIWRGVMPNEIQSPNNAIPLEGIDGILDRYRYPKLIAKGNSITDYAKYYLSYYDNATKQIIMRSFRIGIQGAALGGNMRLFDHSGTRSLNNSTLMDQYCKDSKGRVYGSFFNNGTISNYVANYYDYHEKRRMTATDGASEYFDMAVDSKGKAVIVYYDESASRLAIKYTKNPPDGFTDTSIPFINSLANPLMPQFVGTYVSMCIDSYDRLHIAALDSVNGDLKYIVVVNYDGNTGSAAVKTVTVDQYGAVGYWTDIKLHPSNGRPYIAYYNMAEDYSPIKMAWAKNSFYSLQELRGGVDEDGFTTGLWEYTTVPSVSPPQGGSRRFQKVNIDFLSYGDPILGYLGSHIEYSYRIRERED